MNRHYLRYHFITLFAVILWCIPALSQIEYPGKPFGFSYDQSKGVPYYTVDAATKPDDKQYNNVTHNEEFKIDFFAHTVSVEINSSNAGRWDQINTRMRIWRLGISADGAKSLAVTFDPFFLFPGARVFVYTPKGDHKSGAFTFRNNKPTHLLSAGSIPGDSIIIEMQVSSDIKDFGQFSIATISVGFKEESNEKDTEDEWYGRSAECHVDINCISEPDIQRQKYSACRLIIERTDGRVRCTGTLLNNTSEDGTPYILTAGHCITDMYAAHHTVVYFNYESPYCDGPDGELKSISGTFLRSRTETLDFSLVELSKRPPVDYYPVYSGWNASGDDFDYSYIIHHPQGDVKKFANDSDRVQEGTFAYFDPGTFWLIPDYEIGTTEAGSSGGPLFDQNNHLVGTLSGGGLECTEPIFDYYQKFSEEWDSYPDEEEQLKIWLDPENTGIEILNNLEPYKALSETITNIQPGDILENLTFENGWGYISGHNSLHSVLYAEHFYRNGSKYIYALKMQVAKAYPGNTNSVISIKIWEGQDTPENTVFEKELYLFELTPEQEAYIRMDTLILVNKDFFVGYSINYPEPSDTFALYTVIHDNIDENTAYMNRGNGWELLNDGIQSYSAGLAISPLALNFYPIPDDGFNEFPFDEVTLYPNPTYDILQILLKNKPEGNVYITVYDLLGNVIYREEVIQPEPNFQFQTHNIVRQGIFIIKIQYDNKTTVRKFVKL